MRTVLVVDDEPQVREIAAALFESFGCRVLVAGNATEALRTIETYPGIALLFTDIMMPGMSGVDLAAEVRRRRPGLKIVLTSGYADAVSRYGQDMPMLRKPWRARDIAEILADFQG
jgi:CheY-like chemotaxis protein